MTLIRNWRIRWRQTDRSLSVLTFGVLLYVVRVVGPGWRNGFPSFFPDSASYLKVAKLGPLSPSFWFTERPVGVPFLLWLSAFNTRAFVLLQTLLFAISVAFLCHTILRIMRVRPLAWLTCAAIAAIAIQPRFGLWNLEVLSESLGMSLAIFALTCWLRASQAFTASRIWIATLATVTWMLVRDSHGIPVLVLVIGLTVLAWRASKKDLRSTLFKCIALLLVIFSYISISQGVSNRNQYPLMNNVGLRILPDQEMTNHFVDRGMPPSETLSGRSGRNTWDDGEVFLKAPELAQFRHWVNGSGQTDQLLSLAMDAPFWIDVMQKELPGSLAYDFRDYDRFNTLERLPAQTFGFDSPRTTNQLVLWLATALAAIIALLYFAKSRKFAVFSTISIAAFLTEMYASIAGDAVEVQRHLVGPFLRIFVIVIIAIALAVETLYCSFKNQKIASDDEAVVDKPITRLSAAFAQSAIFIVALGALIANEHRSQDFDPQYTRTIIERAAKFGGSYYQNGIHNKGPLETALYDSARLFTSEGTYWFGISLYVLMIATLLSTAVAAVARISGGSRTIALSASVLTFLHFTISSSDYAGVIYSRNMTTGALAIVFTLIWCPQFWSSVRRSRWTYIASSVVLGLAVQTLLTTLFAAIVIGSALIIHRRQASHFDRPVIIAMTTFGATVLTAPMWYALRGSFNEFWSGWWTYAGFMSAGTGRSLMNQVGLGWKEFVGYYQDRPIMLVLVIAFAFTTWVNWRTFQKFQRVMHIALVLWFISGWTELVLGQRYSSHYFSVLAVPNVFMGAILLAQLATVIAHRTIQQQPQRHQSEKVHYALPIATALIVLFSQCSDLFWTGVEKVGTFKTFAQHETERTQSQGGEGRTTRAVLDLVSHQGDSLLAWTMYPWTYLEHERVPATRFSWKSFMIGEVYLGKTSPKYVLADTWNWFAQDMQQTQPKAFARPKETPLDEQTPFAQYVSANFTTAYDGNSMEVGISNKVWTTLTAEPTQPLDIAEDEIFSETSPFVLSDTHCVRIAGTLNFDQLSDDSGIIFNLSDPTASYENVHLSLSATRASSSSDTVEFTGKDIEHDSAEPLKFVLVVGSRSAVLVVDSKVVAGTRTGAQAQLSVAIKAGQPSLSDLRIDTSPNLNGCSNS
jgi:hypothetical protein